MMKEIKAEIVISATTEKVWAVLADFSNYGSWNPFITSIAGDGRVNGRLSVTIKPPKSKAMAFKPVVLKFDRQKEFRWRGKLLIKGLFDGEHYFILTDNGDGSTTFVQGEQFSGILVGLFSSVLKKTRSGFDLMNEALKQECEK